MKSIVGSAGLALLVAGLLPNTASADASALAYVQDTRAPVPPTPPAMVGPTTATMTAGAASTFQYAYALADQNAGVLRVVGNSGNAGNNLTTRNASASFSERLTFSGGFGQMAYLDYSFDGTLGIQNANPNQAADFGQLQIYEANIFGSHIQYEQLSGFAGNCGPNCLVGTSIARTGTLGFLISEGPNFISASLNAFGSFGNSFDFGNTARFYLRTPEGVTFTSANAFLTTALPIGSTPVSPVPEPETYAMLLAGLGILGVVARRRRSSLGRT